MAQVCRRILTTPPPREPGSDVKKRIQAGDNLDALMVIESSEERAFHDDTSSGVGARLSRDRASGQDIVSGAHLDCDTGLVTFNDGLTYAIAKGVLDTSDGHKGQVTRMPFIWYLIGGVEVDTGGGPRLEVLVAQRNGPQHLIGVGI